MVEKLFSDPGTKSELETGKELTPRFDDKGLVTAIVTDFATGELLMVAHMNDRALQLTLDTGQSHFWSRSRKELWHKGATSGNVQTVHEIRTDCDQDAIWLKVSVEGKSATCHTGMRSCFFRRIDATDGAYHLISDDEEPLFDPSDVYQVTTK